MPNPAIDGFFLALYLVESLGVEVDAAEINQALVDVANGDLTLLNSDAEEHLARGKRKGIDQNHRATATEIVHQLKADGLI